MLGGPGASKGVMAWRQVYRSLEHGFAKNACSEKMISKFPKAIEDFANAFVTMQEKRHSADYDPYIKLTKSEVALDIAITEQVIADFKLENMKDKRAFCTWVLFKKPRS